MFQPLQVLVHVHHYPFFQKLIAFGLVLWSGHELPGLQPMDGAPVKHIYTTLVMWILGHTSDIHYGTQPAREIGNATIAVAYNNGTRIRGHGRPPGSVARLHQWTARPWFLSDGRTV